MSFFLQQIPASGHGSSPAAECHGTPPARAGRQGGAKRGSGSLRGPAAPSRSPSALQQGCRHGRQPRTSIDIFPERCGVSAPVRDSTRASAPQSRARGRGARGGRGARTRLHPPPVAPALRTVRTRGRRMSTCRGRAFRDPQRPVLPVPFGRRRPVNEPSSPLVLCPRSRRACHPAARSRCVSA